MVLTLYGHTMSTCTQRVAVVLLEKQVPFKFVLVDIGKGEQFFPATLEKQPFAKVPFIVEDDGFTLYESRAIMRYIAENYEEQGTQLYPKDIKAKALAEQAFSIEAHEYNSYASQITYEKLIGPRYLGKPADEAKIDAWMKSLEKTLDVYENVLSKQKYLAGDDISLADLSHLAPV